MDSGGNSSSMQSSSGGADPPPDHPHQEYDSNTTPLHFDFNTTTSTPPPPHSHRHHQQHMPPHLPQLPAPNLATDDHLQQPPTTSAFIHPHMMNMINPTNVFHLQHPFSQNFTPTSTTTSWTTTTSPPPPTSIDPAQLLDPTYISFHPSSSSVEAANATSSSSPARPPKNPRKRSRASRRAPTTVLTTDTSNFRAMVQEFTGIPTAPPSSPYSRLLSTSSINRGSSTAFSRPFPLETPIFQTQSPDPFFSFLQHGQHQLAAPPMQQQGYQQQQLPFTNAPFGPTYTHHIPPRDDAPIDHPPPVAHCINDRGVNQVINTSSSCGASSDLLAQQGSSAEQGTQHK